MAGEAPCERAVRKLPETGQLFCCMHVPVTKVLNDPLLVSNLSTDAVSSYSSSFSCIHRKEVASQFCHQLLKTSILLPL